MSDGLIDNLIPQIEVQDVAKMENTTCPEIYDICMVRMAARNRLQQEINARFEHGTIHMLFSTQRNSWRNSTR